MNVVFNTPNDNGLAFQMDQNAAQVSVHLVPQSFVA